MVQIKEFSTLEKKMQWLSSLDSFESTFVCADLKTKKSIQEIFYKKVDFIEDHSIMRVSELWKKINLQTFPSLQIVTHEVMEEFIEFWMVEEKQLKLNKGFARTLSAYLTQLITLHDQENILEEIREWFLAHPSSVISWGKWFEFSSDFYQYLKLNKVVTEPLLPYFLKIDDLIQFKWNRKIIVDLGAQLSAREVQLFNQLSEHLEVIIICPYEDEVKKYEDVLWPYEMLNSPLKKMEKEKANIEIKKEFFKFKSPISEIQFICAQLRELVQKGVQWEDISLVSPQLETYWPTLSFYLKKEGIPFYKNDVSRMISFKPVMRWLNLLFLYAGDIKLSRIEAVNYNTSPHYPFSRLKPKFSHNLKEVMKEGYDKVLDQNIEFFDLEMFTKEEFLTLSLELLPEDFQQVENEELFERIKKILVLIEEEITFSVKKSFHEWTRLLQKFLIKEEVVETQNHDGVDIRSLHESSYLNKKNIFVFGLVQQSPLQNTKTAISNSEALSIRNDLGVNIELPISDNESYFFYKILENSLEGHLFFLSSEFNFQGEETVPHSFLSIESQNNIKEEGYLKETHWEESKQSSLNDIFKRMGWSSERTDYLIKSLEEPSQYWEKVPQVKISSSFLQKYAQCPFIVVSEKFLKLSDEPFHDLDLNPLNLGSLVHHLYEKLKKLNSIDDEELSKIINECLASIKDSILNTGYRKHLFNFLYKKSHLFISHEKKFSLEYPDLNFFKAEVSFKGYFDVDKEMIFSKGSGLPIRGSIDRIDKAGDEGYCLYDYKLSDGNIRNYQKWNENDSYQMALYSKAVENGLCHDLEPKEVLSALYYVDKDLKREKGFKLNELEGNYYSKKSKNLLSREEKEKFIEQIFSNMSEKLRKLNQGELFPCPKDKKNCESCNWRPLCRF